MSFNMNCTAVLIENFSSFRDNNVTRLLTSMRWRNTCSNTWQFWHRIYPLAHFSQDSTLIIPCVLAKCAKCNFYIIVPLNGFATVFLPFNSEFQNGRRNFAHVTLGRYNFEAISYGCSICNVQKHYRCRKLVILYYHSSPNTHTHICIGDYRIRRLSEYIYSL